jgi:dihydroorotate dehydrogenase electron transfer subunit
MGQVYTRHVPPHTARSERGAAVDVDAVVIGNRHLSADYNVLALDAPEIAARTRPGQFVMIKASRGLDPLLRRPFSVFEVLRGASGQPIGISIFNKRAGVGTSLLSELEAGARVQCLGPLGRPFTPIDPPADAWMVAGGVGLAPFLTLAEALAARKTPATLFYGARTGAELYSIDMFEALGVRMVLATEDGTIGVKGRVTVPLEDALRARPLGQPVKLFACGPTPMMRSCARLATAHGRACDVSLEQVMGCGLGGCYSCVVAARTDEGKVHHTRTCIDGPVFDAQRVVWEAVGH